jgi:hypothetical protein
MYSDDRGVTWKTEDGTMIASLEQGGTVDSDAPGTVAFRIPKDTGLSNQEAQAIDYKGGVHVLNRDRMDSPQSWKHYYRPPSGRYTFSNF